MTTPKKPAARKAPKALSLPRIARWIVDDSLLFSTQGSPFVATITEGHPGLMVITGENASGKSLFFRILTGRVRGAHGTCVTLSIRERAGATGSDMAGFARLVMFGEEQEHSTGATSITSIRTAFDHNLDRDGGTVLGLDEPELGLSEAYAVALGRYIGERALAVPKVCAGVVVVTHSRPLVRGLLDGFGSTPTHVAVGDSPAGVQSWLDTPEVRSVEDLLGLVDLGRERWKWANVAMRD